MDSIIEKSKYIKIGSMVLALVFIIVCYQMDVGAYKDNGPGLPEIYLTYTAKMRIEYMGQSAIGTIEDCGGVYFCQVVKQAPIFGGIDLAFAIIIVLIELIEQPFLKDKVKPGLVNNIIFGSLILGLAFALVLMLEFWFAAIGSSDWKLLVGSQIFIILYFLSFAFATFLQIKVRTSRGSDTLLS